MEPVEACRAAGIRAIDLLNAILIQETYVGGTLDLLTQKQRKALVLAVLKEPKAIGITDEPRRKHATRSDSAGRAAIRR